MCLASPAPSGSGRSGGGRGEDPAGAEPTLELLRLSVPPSLALRTPAAPCPQMGVQSSCRDVLSGGQRGRAEGRTSGLGPGSGAEAWPSSQSGWPRGQVRRGLPAGRAGGRRNLSAAPSRPWTGALRSPSLTGPAAASLFWKFTDVTDPAAPSETPQGGLGEKDPCHTELTAARRGCSSPLLWSAGLPEGPGRKGTEDRLTGEKESSHATRGAPQSQATEAGPREQGGGLGNGRGGTRLQKS